MTYNFQDFPCNKCGWCCQRTPCPMGLYIGQTPESPCGLLRETAPNEFECGLVLDEKDEIKKAALKEIIFSGKGCSHIYGPHPVSLMRKLLQDGLNPRSGQWQVAIQMTVSEYEKMASASRDSKSILKALEEFREFCQTSANFTQE